MEVQIDGRRFGQEGQLAQLIQASRFKSGGSEVRILHCPLLKGFQKWKPFLFYRKSFSFLIFEKKTHQCSKTSYISIITQRPPAILA